MASEGGAFTLPLKPWIAQKLAKAFGAIGSARTSNAEAQRNSRRADGQEVETTNFAKLGKDVRALRKLVDLSLKVGGISTTVQTGQATKDD